MSRVLQALVRRARTLAESATVRTGVSGSRFAEPDGTSDKSLNQLRYVAGSCIATCSLAQHAGGGVDDSLFAAAASALTEQLLSLISSFPAAKDIPPETMRSVFGAARRATPFVPAHTLQRLLREADARVNPAAFVLWGPHVQLQILFVAAKAFGHQADVAPLPMLKELLPCVAYELGKLAAPEVAVLLWCLASLQCEQTSLWDPVCRRAALLLSRMSRVSCATTLHAVLMVSHCTCEGQQQLMGALLSSSAAARTQADVGAGVSSTSDESSIEQWDHSNDTTTAPGRLLRWQDIRGGVEAAVTQPTSSPDRRYLPDHAAPLHPHRWPATQLAGRENDFEAVRGKLLHCAHGLSIDILVSLLDHMRDSSSSDAASRDWVAHLEDPDEGVIALLVELARRSRLTADEALCILQGVAWPCAFNEASVLAGNPASSATAVAPLGDQGETGVSHARTLLRRITSNALRELTVSSPQQMSDMVDVVRSLALTVSTGRSDDPPAADRSGARADSFLSFSLPQHEEACRALGSAAVELLRRARLAFGVLDGESAWALATAADVLSRCGKGLDCDVTSALKESEASWARQGPQTVQANAAAVLCAASNALEAVLNSQTPDGSSNPTRTELLDSSIAALADAEGLALPVVSRLLIALETGAGLSSLPRQQATSLTMLMKRLIVALEQATAGLTRASLLAELSLLLASPAPVARRGRMAGRVRPRSAYVPDALLDLYVRVLQRGSSAEVTDAQAEVLVRVMRQRSSQGPQSLERALSLLTTRRLGQKQTFLKATVLPPRALAALIQIAGDMMSRSSAPGHVNAGTAILAALLECVLPATPTPAGDSQTDPHGNANGVSALSRCQDLDALNELAALVWMPVCAELGIKNALANQISQRAIEIVRRKTCRGQDKAMLIALLVRADADIQEPLLRALRGQ